MGRRFRPRNGGGLALLALLIVALLLGGCAHQVAFQDAHYAIDTQRYSRSVVAVIDDATLHDQVEIRSFMTGIAHSWNAEPGLMLKQVADIELPQMFVQYRCVDAVADAKLEDRPLILELSVPSYTFADFHATVMVRAVALSADHQQLFDHSYTATGATQGGKMFWGGAFAMKSAVRQSSIDAYRKVFAQLRGDLNKALQKPELSARR